MTWLVTFRWLSQGAEFHGISPGPPPQSSPAPASLPALRLAACWSRPPAQAVPAEAWPPRAFSWSHLGSRPSSSMKFMPRGVPESPHCLFLTWLPHFCTLLTPKPLSASKAPSLMLVSGPSITCLRSGYLPAPSGLGSASPRHPPPQSWTLPFCSKISIYSIYSSSQFTCAGPGQAGHSSKSTGILWDPANPSGRGEGNMFTIPFFSSGRGGLLPGDRHSSPSHGPGSSLLCPLQKGVLLDLRILLSAT